MKVQAFVHLFYDRWFNVLHAQAMRSCGTRAPVLKPALPKIKKGQGKRRQGKMRPRRNAPWRANSLLLSASAKATFVGTQPFTKVEDCAFSFVGRRSVVAAREGCCATGRLSITSATLSHKTVISGDPTAPSRYRKCLDFLARLRQTHCGRLGLALDSVHLPFQPCLGQKKTNQRITKRTTDRQTGMPSMQTDRRTDRFTERP